MSFEPQLTIPQWLELSWEIRHELIHIFNIPRSSGTETMNGKVISDGHTHADLKHITVEKMQAYLETVDKDFFGLFNDVLVKLAWQKSEAGAVLAKQAEEEQQKIEEEKMQALVESITVLTEAMPKKKIAKPKA